MATDSASVRPGLPGGDPPGDTPAAAATPAVTPDDLAILSPSPDPAAEPNGFTVEVAPAERIHFLDWGGPDDVTGGRPAMLLVHGLSGTAWGWTSVARRLRRVARVVAADLRGHGLSDAPTSGYDRATLAADLVAVAEGAGLVGASGGAGVSDGAGRRVVLAGHGFGGIVAAWAAAELGDRCAGLVLVDGGWQEIAAETGLTPDEWLRDLAEPPEILRSMSSFLDDRRSWDPASWDADEERAARATVVEVPAGKVVAAIRPHALAHSVEAIFAYRPDEVLVRLAMPIVALVAADADGAKTIAMASVQVARRSAGMRPITTVDLAGVGHNVPRHRPDEVAGAVVLATGDLVPAKTDPPTGVSATK